MNWAFVDYENVGTMEGLKLDGYERVFVLCGPKNTRVKLAPPPADGFCRIELIGVSTIGPNNLDFHLAFHLGRFHEITDKAVAFHIISSDGDFDGLVHHLKKIGRVCKRVSPKAEAKAAATPKPAPHAKPAAAPAPALSDTAKQLVDKLKGAGRSRPRKKDGLINWITNRSQGVSDINPMTIYEELVQAKLVRENGKDVSYELGR